MNNRAGFVPRLMAALLDGVALLILSLVLGGFLGSVFGTIIGALLGKLSGHAILGSAVFMSIFGVLGTLILMWLLNMPYSLIECFTGWTPGKYLLGLQIRNQDGRAASTGQLVGRWLIRHVAVLLAILSFTTIPFVALTPMAQGIIFVGCFLTLLPARLALHDMASGTAVYPKSEE